MRSTTIAGHEMAARGAPAPTGSSCAGSGSGSRRRDRRGNHLIEISRASAAPAGPLPAPVLGLTPPPAPPALPVRGTLDFTALGATAIPFELTGARRGRPGRGEVEERFEDLEGTPVQRHDGPGRRIVPDRPARVP
jgi:hypothetical protein